MEARVVGETNQARMMEINRPGKTPWLVVLPAALDRGALLALADYVTARYLVELPVESVRLGWETIYGLVRAALLDAGAAGADEE